MAGEPKKESAPSGDDESDSKPHNPLEDEFKPGTWVEITGLDSSGGKKLNGQQGTIVKYVYEKIRFEVQLTEKVVSVRPVNLNKVERPDRKWGYGDICRVVGLREDDDEKLRAKSGSLGTLQFKGKDGYWKVNAGGEIHKVMPQNLRVCAEDDERGLWAPDFTAKYVIGAASVGTMILILGVLLVLVDLSTPTDAPRVFPFQLNLEPALDPHAPGYHVALVCLVVVVWAFLWLWGTVFGCCWLHSCLSDPQSCFPQISELCVGRTSAGMLFRLGFGTVAVLLLATVMLHHNLVLPRLPWKGVEGNGAEDALFWGVTAAIGVGAYGYCLIKVRPSWPGLVHKFAGCLILWSFYKYLSIQSLLYFPAATKSWAEYLAGSEGVFPDPEGAFSGPELAEGSSFGEGGGGGGDGDLVKEAKDRAAESEYLKNPIVSITLLVRYQWLTRMPWGILMIPVLKPIFERSPENSKVAPSTIGQSMLAWLQWFLVFNCGLIHASYAPELVMAALLPMPIRESRSGDSPGWRESEEEEEEIS